METSLLSGKILSWFRALGRSVALGDFSFHLSVPGRRIVLEEPIFGGRPVVILFLLVLLDKIFSTKRERATPVAAGIRKL